MDKHLELPLDLVKRKSKKKLFEKILALQLLFTPLSYPGFQIFDMLTINMYTAPAYLACSMNFLGALALYFLFKENYAGIVDEEDNEQQPENVKIF